MKRSAAAALGPIYCSGPLFCPEEVAGMAALAETLEAAGYQTFLPHRDGLEAWVSKALKNPRLVRRNPVRLNRLASKAVFALDLYQIVERCVALVINLNGRVPDEGAVAEAAVAFTLGKPVVAYKNDARAPFHGDDNSMVIGLSSAFSTVNRLRGIPAALRRAMERTGKQTAGPACPGPALPPNVRQAADYGRQIWGWMQRLGLPGARNEQEAADLLKRLLKACEDHPARKDPVSF